MLTSLIAFTLLYGVLAVIEIGLMLHYIKRGADPFEEPPNPRLGEPDDQPARLRLLTPTERRETPSWN